MCTYNKKLFQKWLENTMEKVLDAEAFHEALEIVAESVIAYYPDTKICFAEKFGKRWSHIIGKGKESFTKSEKVLITNQYGVFLQGFDNIPLEEKETLLALCKIVVAVKG